MLPEVTKIDYRQRQQRALKLIEGSALLVCAIPEATRNSDVHHPFRQDSTLYYLCGGHEQETALLLVNVGGVAKVYAFVRPNDALAELWEGKRVGVAGAPAALSVDEAMPIDQLWQELPRLMKGARQLYYTLGIDESNDRNVIAAIRQERRLRGRASYSSFMPICDADAIAGKLRGIKQEDELLRMRRAAFATAKGFNEVYSKLRPNMNERDVYGMLVGTFLQHGAEMEAYPAIVAGGANACCLHYRSNNQTLRDGQLLLIDAAAQFDYYASDVTRTFPVGKTFTAEQKAVYEAVLDTQLLGISLSRVGQTMTTIHDATCKRITEHLVDLGLIKGNATDLFEAKAFRKYFPHGTGHWLGMDVHDVGNYSNESGEIVSLQPGMVFTVEPGIYIDPNDQDVAPAWRGIGVRIEDDIVVTTGEPEVLTAAIAKQVKDLEHRY